MVSISQNIPKNDNNFFHRMFENFTIGFIVFIDQLKPRKEITFIKERSETILLNTISNSLNKMTIFKNMINIFTILIAKKTRICIV